MSTESIVITENFAAPNEAVSLQFNTKIAPVSDAQPDLSSC
jgi:hypothetical protein